MRRSIRLACLLAAVAASPWAVAGDSSPVTALGANLQYYDYPYQVQEFAFESQGDTVNMGYMDIEPLSPNGHTAVLLHGKNFCGAYWYATMKHLTARGYRVVVPDQIGFCKSDKPHDYQYSFQQLAANTHALLASLKIDKAVVIGHSMGGMLAARYALMYPQSTEQLILVDPIGLEDWKAKGVPWHSIEDEYAKALKTDLASIRSYQTTNYYGGQWSPEYAKWARLQAGMYAGDGRKAVAWAAARTHDMIYSQPVVHEFPDIHVPTVLIIGQRDRTAPGKDSVDPSLAKKLGDYPKLGRDAARHIPGARLIALDGLGHLPQIQAPDRFYAALDDALGPIPQDGPAPAASSPAPGGSSATPASPLSAGASAQPANADSERLTAPIPGAASSSSVAPASSTGTAPEPDAAPAMPAPAASASAPASAGSQP